MVFPTVCTSFLLHPWQDFSAFLPLKQHWTLPSPWWFLAYSYPRASHVEIQAPKTEQLFTSIRQETLSKQLKWGRWGSKPRRKGHGWQHKLTSTTGQPTGSSISLRSSTELVQSYSATQNYNLSLHWPPAAQRLKILLCVAHTSRAYCEM